MKTRPQFEDMVDSPEQPALELARIFDASNAHVQSLPVSLKSVPPAPDQETVVDETPVEKGSGKKAKKKKKAVGTVRGIETMFRTAYRTQLDLTALAATKANIMISLNGFILSVLTLSGPFVLVAEPMFTIPIAVFLATCLSSMLFAVLAARPHVMRKKRTLADFQKDRANILVFEQFSALEEKQHLKAMKGMMRDNDRIYKNMTRQLYYLGTAADRKFRFLGVSYATFLAGLTVSTLLLLAIGFLHHTPDLATILGQLRLRFAG